MLQSLRITRGDSMNLNLNILSPPEKVPFLPEEAFALSMYLIEYMKDNAPEPNLDLLRIYTQEYKVGINWKDIPDSKADALLDIYRSRLPEFYYQCMMTKLMWLKTLWGKAKFFGNGDFGTQGRIRKGMKKLLQNYIALPKITVGQNTVDIFKPRIDALGLSFYTVLGNFCSDHYEFLTEEETREFDETTEILLQRFVDNCNGIRSVYTEQRQADLHTYVEQICDLVKLYLNVHCPFNPRPASFHATFQDIIERRSWYAPALAAASTYSNVSGNAVVCMFPGVKYHMGYNRCPNVYKDTTKFLFAQHLLWREGKNSCKEQDVCCEIGEPPRPTIG